jgi:hypothetical protein
MAQNLCLATFNQLECSLKMNRFNSYLEFILSSHYRDQISTILQENQSTNRQWINFAEFCIFSPFSSPIYLSLWEIMKKKKIHQMILCVTRITIFYVGINSTSLTEHAPIIILLKICYLSRENEWIFAYKI